MKEYIFVLEDELSPIIIGGEDNSTDSNTQSGTVASAEQTTSNNTAPSSLGGMNMVTMVLVYGAVFFALWFFMIRPQRKREKEAREMQSAIRAGDNVLTSSGMYGKVAEVGEDCFVVEFGTNRGIRIPVRKSDVLGIKTPNVNPAPSAKE